LYHDDQRISRIITSFAAIAMIICSLGLYGLSSFMAERRLKEIGVRKVMGASVSQIVRMMSGEFVKLVLLAFAIATPLAWYVMDKWLQGFEYKTSLHFSVFTYAGVASIIIALATITFESLKAANTDPARTLRNQ
jgi:putative ABC transport system permease protein